MFGGTDDPWALTDSLAGWGDETDGPFDQHLFPGRVLYFMDDAFGSMARRIAARPALKEVSSLAAR
jgi:hypothetical protein